MSLIWWIAIPLIGAVATLVFSRLYWRVSQVVVYLCVSIVLYAQCALWVNNPAPQDGFLDMWQMPWLPQLGVSLHFGVDGLSLVMCILTSVMVLFGTLIAREPEEHGAGAFYACLLSMWAGMMGIFLSLDLLVFLMCWEAALVPLLVMLLLSKSPIKLPAAAQFFVFTQGSGLALLLSIVGLAFCHYQISGVLSFDITVLQQHGLPVGMQVLLATGFVLAFLVKLPAIGFHVWVPGMFEATPVAGLLVGIMVKTGAYGLIRFVLGLFPEASAVFAPFMMVLGVATLLLGAFFAFGQKEVSKLLAYSTVSHMGLVLAGIFSGSPLAERGVIVLLLTSGLSTGGLLIVWGFIKKQYPEYVLSTSGGLYAVMPRGGLLAIVFTMASVGLPGLGNFVGELMVLMGVYSVERLTAFLLATGVVFGAIYALWLMQRLFFGQRDTTHSVHDVSFSAAAACSLIALILLGLGLAPSPMLNRLDTAWHAPQILLENGAE